jgi:hypothetical protein
MPFRRSIRSAPLVFVALLAATLVPPSRIENRGAITRAALIVRIT